MFGKKKRRIKALEAENAALKAENTCLKDTETELRLEICELKDENNDLKAKLAKRDESPSYAQIVDEWLNGEESANGQ